MNIHLALSTLYLSLIIVSGVVLFITLLVLFYFLFVRNRALAHQVREVNRRYNYIHHLLVEEDSKHLKHIEYISQVNLLYTPIYEKHMPHLTHLKDGQDVIIGLKIQKFNEALDDKHYKQIREEISEFKQSLTKFEDEVNKLNNDLIEILKPEEECNQMIIKAKDDYLQIKQDYALHNSELSILKNSYNEAFKYVDKQFEQFKQYVDQANYLEAINLMPSINKLINELNNINNVMPRLCKLANHEVLLAITNVESEYKRLSMEGYPIQHIVTPKQISKMRDNVHAIIHELKNFTYKDKEDELIKIKNKTEEYLTAFNKERMDRKTFEKEEAPTYLRVTKIEKDFIKLCNSIPKIQKIYAISDEKIMIRNQIQNRINRIGVSKRSLETFVHTIGKKQPYSVLLKRTLQLKNDAEEIEKMLYEFKEYLTLLKEDVENAYNLVSKFYYQLRHVEKILRDIAIDKVESKYKDKIDEIYLKLEKINTTALSLPIQVHEINDAVNYLKYDGESILNQIEQENNMLKLAESSIVYLNKDRREHPELNVVAKQNEKAFFDGEFEKAYNEATRLIKRYASAEEE